MKKNTGFDVELLEKIIVGRVEPQIYAFSTETVPNYLKVGDTYRPIEVRLNEWRKYFPNLIKQFQEVAKVGEDVFFRDFAIHKYLENEIKKERLLPGTIESIPYYSKEFFKDALPKNIEEAITDIKDSYENNDSKYQLYTFEDSRIPLVHTYRRIENYNPRPNQQETIDNFKQALEKGRTNLLMYAVMRFGKSFTSMCCAVEMNAKIVLIVSAKADVKEEWKKTVESHIKFGGFNFLDSNSLLENEAVIKEKIEKGEKVALFLTLQDLMGDEIKEKHKEVFETDIDLLLIDETHFGARASEYGKVLRGFKKGEVRSELKLNEDSLDELEENTKIINSKVRIHLSGTPYRILMNSEFTEEDIIAFYQFTNIVEDQEEWNEKHLMEDDIKEWENPYYGFPQMIRFAFNPNKSSRKKMEELKKSGITYAFSELLKPKSILKDTKSELHKEFIHQKEIVDLLKVIDGSQEDESLLGFLDYDKLKEGEMCRHIVCVLPYRASCDAFEELLKRIDFKNLSSYEVINISGVENEKLYKDTQSVKTKIEECEKDDRKTITLTVNRMLTGSTVPQWDTMLYFKDTASPQEYDQAIFRLQSQYIKTYKEPNGDTLKYNMKPQTLLVDFNPNRMFRMQEQKSQIYNVNTEYNGNDKLEERIEKELRISPIIVINNKKIVEVEPVDILDAIREYSSERSVLDEATSISIDYSLLDIEEIKLVIDKQNKIGSKLGFEITPTEGEGDDIQTEDKPDNEQDEGENGKSPSLDKDEKNDYKGKFAMYYARILFFSFLTDDKVKSLQEINDSLDFNEENERIASNLNLEIEVLKLFQKHINPFVLSELDYKIYNINSLANDITLSPIDRASNAMKKFSRLSDSEIVTPELVTGKMIDTIPEEAFTNDAKILDIASKQGEFVYAVCKKHGKQIANNFYSIPTSKVAYEFTRKVYKLLELDLNNIEKSYTSYDLLEENDLNSQTVIIINNSEMKFDVIVGNPPYQKSISTNTKNRSLSKQIFPDFIKTCIGLNPNYLSLVSPSRWFTGDAQDKSFLRLREFFRLNNHIQNMVNIPISSSVFPDVEISGGINFFLYNPDYQGDVEFTEYYDEENNITFNRPLFEEGLDIILSSGFSHSIIKKVVNENFVSINKITKGRNAFGILGKNADEVSDTTKQKGYYELRCKHEEIRYVKKDLITKNLDLADKWKIFISKSNGGAGLLTDSGKVSIIGKPYLAKPHSVCTDSLIPIGNFSTKYEAEALVSYLRTKFLRYMVGILKTSQNILQNVYMFVPLQDFTPNSDINWTKSIEKIDKQLYHKYGLDNKEIQIIEKKIKCLEM